MNSSSQDFPYWIALAHLPRWRTERINQLIINILHKRQINFSDFFEMNIDVRSKEFSLSPKESHGIEEAKLALPNCAFIAEDLLAQGFQLIPINSPEYSETLKKNLQAKQSPPLLYVKGNTKLLNEQSVAVVGSRNASEKGLQFADQIAKKCTKDYQVVVSGFAKGVDKQALDSSIKYIGHSIIVLPQGIMTFGSGIKKYYKQIIEGDVLVLSTFHPKAGWDVGRAMSRNTIIYGLAEEIYVAEADTKGGTWSGVIDGLRKGRKIYVRLPDEGEHNANNILIEKGAIAVDGNGDPIKLAPAPEKVEQDKVEEKTELPLEERLINLLRNASRPYTLREIKDELLLIESTRKLSSKLKSIPDVKCKKVKSQIAFYLNHEMKEQTNLFTD